MSSTRDREALQKRLDSLSGDIACVQARLDALSGSDEADPLYDMTAGVLERLRHINSMMSDALEGLGEMDADPDTAEEKESGLT